MTKFKALAYIGVFELQNIGVFDSREEAFAALQEHLEKQLEGEEEKNHIEEAFWFDSNIVEVEEGAG